MSSPNNSSLWVCHILVFLAVPPHCNLRDRIFLLCFQLTIFKFCNGLIQKPQCLWVGMSVCMFRTNWWMCVRKYSFRHWGLRSLSTTRWQPKNRSSRWEITPTRLHTDDHAHAHSAPAPPLARTHKSLYALFHKSSALSLAGCLLLMKSHASNTCFGVCFCNFKQKKVKFVEGKTYSLF